MRFGRRMTFWIAVSATGLAVQACTQQPAAPGARVFAADMAGAAKSCTVSKVVPAAGQQTNVTMTVGNDGGWCAITVNDRGKPFGAGLLTGQATHGKVVIHTVGDDTRIDYTPAARYIGADSFTVRLVPGDATLRVAVSVAP